MTEVVEVYPPAPIVVEVYTGALNSGGSGEGGVTDHGLLTGLGDNDHPQYATDAELTSGLATKADTHSHPYEASGAVAGHEAAGNPHPNYATDTDLSTGLATKADTHSHPYDATGTAAAAVSAHVAAGDPHTGYATDADLTAGLATKADTHSHPYSGTAHDHSGTYATLVSGTVPDNQIPAAIARDTEVSGAITTHEGLTDPHPGYALDTDVTGAVAAHTGDATDAHAGSAVTFSPSGLTVITGTATVQGALATADAAFVADRARLSAIETNAWVTTARIGDGQVTAAKVAADVATQAELDAAVAYANPPSARAAVTTFNLANATTVKPTLAAPSISRGGTWHSTTVNPTRLTVPAGCAGTYLVLAHLLYASNSTGFRVVHLYVNNTQIIDSVVPPVSGAATFVPAIRLVELAVGDYVELGSHQTSGGSLSVTGSSEIGSQLQVVRVAA